MPAGQPLSVALCTEFLSGPANGTQIFLLNLIASLKAKHGDDVRLTIVLPKDGVKRDDARAVIDRADRVIRLKRGRWFNRLSWLMGRNSITRTIGRHDVYMSGFQWPLGGKDTPFIGIIHDLMPSEAASTGGSVKERLAQYLWNRSVSACAARAAAIVVPSGYTLERYDSLGFARPAISQVIPHGVDYGEWSHRQAGAFEDACATLNIGADEHYVLSVGQHVPRKNFGRLIEAFAGSAASDGKLVIVGKDNSETGALREIIAAKDLQDSVVLAGALPFAQLRALVQHARIFAFPSLYEGFGLPVLEAYAAGVPVITSNTTSLGEIAGDGALCVDPASVAELRGAIDRLWHDDDLRTQLIARGDAIARNATWDAAADRYLDLFRKMAGRHG